MGKGVKILRQDCDPSLAEDRSKFDLVSAAKQVDIFDYYWDLYRYDFVNMTQSEGRANPKLWNDPNEKKKK